MTYVSRIILHYLLKRATFRMMIGRYRDPENPGQGRFVRRDIDQLLEKTFKQARSLVPNADLSRYKSRGNRLNVLLGVYSLAAYRAMRDSGIEHEWAVELFGDIGWRLYTLGVKLPLFFIRPFTRDSQKRLNAILRVFLFFPFAEDPVGYHRKYRKESNHFVTDWYRCVVYDYFRANGTDEEIDLFRRSWCQYDFALPRLIDSKGFYERPHTLSNGDDVCDMRWYGIARSKDSSTEGGG